MLELLLISLIIFWFLGYVRVDSLILPDYILFTLNGRNITLWNILILVVIAWIIGVLPSPFREIASVFLVLWILSVLGVIGFAGLPSILIISLIIGLIAYLTAWRGHSHDV
ncbi:MAG: hypothetical protein WC489_01145 [Patescibacteria group bacterium]